MVGRQTQWRTRHCAVRQTNVGDFIHFDGGGAAYGLASTLSQRLLQPSTQDALVAIDAPLGWPRPLAEALPQHAAGAPIGASANPLFRRTTDHHIHKTTGKQPLDVGADRIARTAEAALTGLGYLRTKTGEAVPLAWCHEHARGTMAIEAYPTVTLKVHSLQCDGYKKNADDGHICARKKILPGLLGEMTIPARCRETAGVNADGLDALVCLLAAADFLEGRAMPPQDTELAHREGWIRCCAPDHGDSRFKSPFSGARVAQGSLGLIVDRSPSGHRSTAAARTPQHSRRSRP